MTFSIKQWQAIAPFDAVIFDCDSTLSQIEGITALSEQNNVAEQVIALTEQAMSETGISEDLYKQRLDLVQPSASQVEDVADLYYQHLTLDINIVLETLRLFNKAVYIASAGIYQSVVKFAQRLALPSSHVYAVEIFFDDAGNYKNFDQCSPLIRQKGKREIVQLLREQHQRIVHIGDGMNDVEAASFVDRFIGYGGACYRKNIEDMSDFYIKTPSMLPVLPLILTAEEVAHLTGNLLTQYKRGLSFIEAKKVSIS